MLVAGQGKNKTKSTRRLVIFSEASRAPDGLVGLRAVVAILMAVGEISSLWLALSCSSSLRGYRCDADSVNWRAVA